MMLRTTLEQWRMLKAVVEHGGFNQAAEIVHKSQSTIHHAVHKLEEVLGVTLLQVHGRKVSLTHHGELMLRHAERLLSDALALETIASSLNDGVETRLHIAVDCAFPQQKLFDVLHAVSDLYPHLNIQLMETTLAGANELVENGKAEIAISPIPYVEGLNDELCLTEFVAVANPNHPLHQLGRSLTENDLKPFRQIVTRDSSSKNYNSGWLDAHQRWTVSHLRTSVSLVASGLGFAWLPMSEIEHEMQQGRLKPLPFSEGGKRKIIFYMNFADADTLGPAARSFIGELRAHTHLD